VKPQSHNLAEAWRDSSTLAGLTALLWLILAGPVFWWQGTAGLEGLSMAALLCLLPGCLVFLLGAWFSGSEKSATQLAIPLGSTVLRLIVVLAGVLLIRELRPDLGFTGFLLWVVVFYFATLAVETRVLLKKPASTPAASKSSPAEPT